MYTIVHSKSQEVKTDRIRQVHEIMVQMVGSRPRSDAIVALNVTGGSQLVLVVTASHREARKISLRGAYTITYGKILDMNAPTRPEKKSHNPF